ncbi:hypothetical protein V1512DRAFT_267527 [Lipomyces arxii]|uniref:uncharacterized protein n=1 Tax=Lipomyces arxii TaxID=56418 RepID=UPI0034CD5F81
MAEGERSEVVVPFVSVNGNTQSGLSGNSDPKNSTAVTDGVQTPSLMMSPSLTSRTSVDSSMESYAPSNLHLAVQYSDQRVSSSSSSSMMSLRRDISALGFDHSSIGTNAISSILNSPTASAAAARANTAREIPQVILTNINIIPPEDFDSYVSSAGPEYEQYIHLHTPEIPDRGALAPSRKDSLQPHVHKQRRQSITITPLSTIPQVYFDTGFNLENPRIFDIVSERSDILSSTPSDSSPASANRKSLANNSILQEKLSWYLDTVEVHLINEISKASPSFFAALGDLRNLHTETTNAVERISGLREDLKRVDKEQAQVGLEIVRLQKRRENVARLQQSVDQMAFAIEGVRTAEALWRQGDPHGCYRQTLEADKVIDAVADLGWKFPLTNLSTVPAAGSIKEVLRQLRIRVNNEFQIRFTLCLLEDLRRHVASVSTEDTMARLSKSYASSKIKIGSGVTGAALNTPINTTYLNLPETLKPELIEHLHALAKIGAVDAGVQRYRDAVMREVKNLIKRNLPTNANDDTISVASSATGRTATTAQKSATLERMLRDMRPHEFESMLVDIFTGVSELLRRLSMHQKLLLDITSSMDTILDISDLMLAVADVTQVRTVRIINVRKDVNAFPDPPTFASFYNVCRVFLAECEAITGKYGSTLLSTVMAQQPPPPPQQANARPLQSNMRQPQLNRQDFK